ncbi:Hypothetical Protein FCC1311_035642 [Hondaea fermentalgiana]|uniref:t-SNARE coiled-coil homology domain-containing protein n=1 Tax=Hondaea fermentalgiana TaxID=2315210 RepID=A0A2R5G8F8_9STRA|nr:Hypothetical Protein FCC1311_035642 [Hondaea fermentalgiana]|eukprot:GBG27342.1 Hypothetical Protein FCC1311_035642 [Hondaea fermentalgiana]
MAVTKAKRSKRVIEVEDLLMRLRAIEKEMPVQEKKDKTKASSDRFMEAKKEFLAGMASVKDSLRSMHDTKGITRSRDQIAQAHQVRKQLKDLNEIFLEMERLHSKEVRKKRRKLSDEELATRTQFLQEFKVQLERMKKLSSKATSVTSGAAGTAAAGGVDDQDLEVGGSGFDTASFFRNLDPGTGGASSGARTQPKNVELTEMQQQSLEQIKRRDQEFDEVLDQIGELIDQAGEKAKIIQDEINLQDKMMDEVDENLAKAKVKMDNLNVALKKNLEDSGMGMERFCINIMCFILLLGVVGIILSFV